MRIRPVSGTEPCGCSYIVTVISGVEVLDHFEQVCDRHAVKAALGQAVAHAAVIEESQRFNALVNRWLTFVTTDANGDYSKPFPTARMNGDVLEVTVYNFTDTQKATLTTRLATAGITNVTIL